MNLARLALLAAVCVADGIFLLKVTPAIAAEIITDMAPPQPRTENMGHPPDGFVWAAGHWEWNGQAYRWISGSWIADQGEAHWIADQWEPMGTQWRYVPGHWERLL